MSCRLILLSIIFITTIWLLPGVALAGDARTITLMTHNSFNASKDVIRKFEKQNNVKLKVFKAGNAGEALVKAILSKGNPMADVFFGVDNTFFSRAIKADIFLPYNSPELVNIADNLKIDKKNRLLPISFGDVCLNYDRKWFAENKLTPPADLTDLLKPEYRGLTVVQNPASSSPGLAFLLATIGKFGEEGYLSYWKSLRANDVLVVNGWEAAYFSHFTAASRGNRPIVVSYGSSPAAAVYYSEKPLAEAPTGAVLSSGSAFRQVEFVGILKGTKKQELAEKLVDFMLSRSFQEDIPLQMFVFPANQSATLPEIFVQHSGIAENPSFVSPESIEKNREKWIDAWTDTVLR
jgi:thiamine transport system substrate-binding protein